MAYYIDKRNHILKECIATLCFDGPLDRAIEILEQHKEDHEEEYLRLYIETETEYCYEGGGSTELILYGERKENAEEKKQRLARQKKDRKKKEDSLAKQKERIRKQAEKLGMTVSE